MSMRLHVLSFSGTAMRLLMSCDLASMFSSSLHKSFLEAALGSITSEGKCTFLGWLSEHSFIEVNLFGKLPTQEMRESQL